MSIKIRLFFLMGTGLLTASIMSLVSFLGNTHMAEAVKDNEVSLTALRNHLEADMMHDAIRGDAQLAYIGALENDTARVAEAEKGLKDHAETYLAALDKLQSLPLNAESRDAEAAARPLVTKYISTVVRSCALQR